MTVATDALQYNPDSRELVCLGEWVITHLPNLQAQYAQIEWPSEGNITFLGADITHMDSAGAWLLSQWKEELEKDGLKVKFEKFSKEHQALLTLVEKKVEAEEKEPAPEVEKPFWVAKVGMATMRGLDLFQEYLAFIGKLTFEALRVVREPKHLRWNAFASVIYRTGYEALPIIALLSILIGVVITYQMGLQLKNYGANIFIVDLLGLSILREFGPLITAIMVAGRTGSAFTAQIGMMKLNEEVDALDTMGVTPGELLLIPRIVGLFIALPLLTIWADIFGVIGGMVMSNNMLGITWVDFLERFPKVIPLKTLFIGLGKAPIFALLIASIGCFQGMKVQGGAESVGLNTTRSVVMSIFFIIVADAIFSVLFSKLKL
jgi:phospholipid/cholesterol/gamma-HCH transport system permease protein